MNVQPDLPPSQIDYILVTTRWSSSTRNCITQWGLPIKAHGKKFDHAIVTMFYKLKFRTMRTSRKKEFKSLLQPQVSQAHEDSLEKELNKSERPNQPDQAWDRFSTAMQKAQETLPETKPETRRKWETSSNTLKLVQKRKDNWEKMEEEEKKTLNKEISRSARNDYRTHISNLVTDLEAAESTGKTTQVFKIAKQLSTRGRGNNNCQPSQDNEGNPITSTSQQLEAWACFLEKKFSARPDEPVVNLQSQPDEVEVLDISMQEVKLCVSQLKSGKAPGPDRVPIEQYKNNNTAITELHHVLLQMWREEQIPEDFVLGEMLNLYKRKDKNNRANYRSLGLMNHGYKVFSKVLLMRIIPFIDPKLSDMQSGFRKSRGCQDNILILTMTVNHLLQNCEEHLDSLGIITYIDFVAAFDSILHSYLFNALKAYGVPSKYLRLIAAIYNSAAVQVRIQEKNGERCLSRKVLIRRGALQGDIPASEYFLVALDKLLKDHGGSPNVGIQVTPNLKLEDLEYADDAGLADVNNTVASNRITNLDEKAETEAGMSISVPKTKVQHIQKRPKVSATTEKDINDLPPEYAFKFICAACNRSFPTKHGLAVHRGRWCKGKRKKKQPSRRGTVADRVIQRRKVDEYQKSLPKVKLHNEYLENVFSFEYLGAEMAADGDPLITIQHRCDKAWNCFSNYRTVLTTTKLPVSLRLRLYSTIVVTKMTYGSSAWMFTKEMKKKLNGVNSKMLSQITKRSIHDEARQPSFHVVNYVLERRRSYLGHILRMEEDRALRRFLLELSPSEKPFIPGSLLADTSYDTVEEIVNAAADRDTWRAARRQ